MVHLIVSGVSCQHCVRAITNSIHSKYPQAFVNIDLATQTVHVEGVEDHSALSLLIEEAGYQVQAAQS